MYYLQSNNYLSIPRHLSIVYSIVQCSQKPTGWAYRYQNGYGTLDKPTRNIIFLHTSTGSGGGRGGHATHKCRNAHRSDSCYKTLSRYYCSKQQVLLDRYFVVKFTDANILCTFWVSYGWLLLCSDCSIGVSQSFMSFRLYWMSDKANPTLK